MVLTTLAEIIYNFYLLVYYVLKSCAFVGFLLFDVVYHVSSATYYCIQIIHHIVGVVYEDNRYLIQDVKSVLGGTADFFVNNLAIVYYAIRNIGNNVCKAVTEFLALPSILVDTVKRALVLIGEAVWFLFTLPLQLATLLVDVLQTLLQKAANALFEQIRSTANAFIHYTTHDVPLEAACGLALLVLAFYFPTTTTLALNCFLTTVSYFYRQLGSLIAKCIRLVNGIKNKLRTIISRSRWSQFVAELGIVQLCIGLHAFAAMVYDRGIRLVLANLHSLFTLASNDEPQPARAVRARRRETPNRSTIGSCIICEDNDRSVAFVPCGHICVCKSCSIHLCYHNPVCPLCRSYIQQKLEIYI